MIILLFNLCNLINSLYFAISCLILWVIVSISRILRNLIVLLMTNMFGDLQQWVIYNNLKVIDTGIQPVAARILVLLAPVCVCFQLNSYFLLLEYWFAPPCICCLQRSTALIPQTPLINRNTVKPSLTHYEDLERHTFSVQTAFAAKGRLKQHGHERAELVIMIYFWLPLLQYKIE